jgi:hypothetical protein
MGHGAGRLCPNHKARVALLCAAGVSVSPASWSGEEEWSRAAPRVGLLNMGYKYVILALGVFREMHVCVPGRPGKYRLFVDKGANGDEILVEPGNRGYTMWMKSQKTKFACGQQLPWMLS